MLQFITKLLQHYFGGNFDSGGTAWPVWSGCNMTCFCGLTGTKFIYSVHKYDCELLLLCDANRGNSYSSLAIF